MKKQNNIAPLTTICHLNQVTVSTQMILQQKTISAENRTHDADNEAVVNTGHTAKHKVKAASDNVNVIQNAHICFNLV
jgi:hypothetical protein